MSKIAYIRVSTKEQNTARQYELLKERNIVPDKVYEEHISGKNTDRPYGRPPAVLSDTFASNYRIWKAGKMTSVQFMKKENLPRTTFYRLVKRYESQ